MTDAEKIARLAWFVDTWDKKTIEHLQQGEVPIVVFDAECVLAALRAIVNGEPRGGFEGPDGIRRIAASRAALRRGAFGVMYPGFIVPAEPATEKT